MPCADLRGQTVGGSFDAAPCPCGIATQSTLMACSLTGAEQMPQTKGILGISVSPGIHMPPPGMLCLTSVLTVLTPRSQHDCAASAASAPHVRTPLKTKHRVEQELPGVN